jgi:hypothetical protein
MTRLDEGTIVARGTKHTYPHYSHHCELTAHLFPLIYYSVHLVAILLKIDLQYTHLFVLPG